MSAIGCVLAGATLRQTIVVSLSGLNADYVLSPSSPGVSDKYRAGYADIQLFVSGDVYATTTANAALTVSSSFAAGDTIQIVNSGNILGHGGNGGKNSTGFAGGPAVSTNFNTALINNGVIAGGGGGGGGSGSNGAGGGGGAGGGDGGWASYPTGSGSPNPSTVSGFNGGLVSGKYTGGGGGWAVYPGGNAGGNTAYGGPGVTGVTGYGNTQGGGGGAYLNSTNTSDYAQSGYGSGTAATVGGTAAVNIVSGSTGTAVQAGGGGGGWGAAGGDGKYRGNYAGSVFTYAGGAGGAALNKNGYTVTTSGIGTYYGAINA